VLESLPEVELPLRCPRCGQMHRWTPKDAWLAQSGDLTRH
jgi:hypothetical protein